MEKNIIIGILSCFIFLLIIKIHWQFNDINWLATIIGAIITGLITWFAIDKTSKQDKLSRKFEKKYTYYQEELLNLNNNLQILKDANWSFYDEPENLSHMLHRFIKDKYCDVQKIENIKNILSSLGVYEKKWRNEQYISLLETIINIQKRYNILLSSFLTNHQNQDIFSISENNISYNVQILMNRIKSENNEIIYDYQKNKDLINEMQTQINNEFDINKD